MDSGASPPGFDRVEIEGQKRAFYLSKPQELGLAPGCLPRKLNDLSQVTAFLSKENIVGVDISQFDFRKRMQKRTPGHSWKKMILLPETIFLWVLLRAATGVLININQEQK